MACSVLKYALGVWKSASFNRKGHQPTMRGWPARKADNLIANRVDCLESVGASTSQNPMGLHSLLPSIILCSVYLLLCVGSAGMASEKNVELLGEQG
jgi:hypothetical protein